MHLTLRNWKNSQRTASIYRIDPKNIGDLISTPIHYFPFLARSKQLDLFAEAENPSSGFGGLILGGGGCIGHPPWVSLLEAYGASSVAAKIVWGAGQNVHDSTRVRFPDTLNKFHLVGLRDYPNPWRWTPCSSCLHPAFDKKYEVKHKFVFFEQTLFSPIDSGTHPKMSNNINDMQAIIAFLASGDTVFSSSYHGIYWATLLGRKAVAVNPFSSKFHRLRFPVPVVVTNDWESAARDAVSYPSALELCREANLSFAKDALALLSDRAVLHGADSCTSRFKLQKPSCPKTKRTKRMLPIRAFGKIKRIVRKKRGFSTGSNGTQTPTGA